MKYQFDGYNWLIKLKKGELLIESLIKFARKEKPKGGWLSGIGGAVWAEVAIYDLQAKGYEWKRFDKSLEITSLQGNIAWDAPLDSGEPVIHLHGTFSDMNMHGIGGHLKEVEIGGTCEIFLHNWFEKKLMRVQDDETGLKLLDL